MLRRKIAVAVAIIRQKPPHLSGQQFVEQLRAIYLNLLQEKNHIPQQNENEKETIPLSNHLVNEIQTSTLPHYKNNQHEKNKTQQIPLNPRHNIQIENVETILPSTNCEVQQQDDAETIAPSYYHKGYQDDAETIPPPHDSNFQNNEIISIISSPQRNYERDLDETETISASDYQNSCHRSERGTIYLPPCQNSHMVYPTEIIPPSQKVSTHAAKRCETTVVHCEKTTVPCSSQVTEEPYHFRNSGRENPVVENTSHQQEPFEIENTRFMQAVIRLKAFDNSKGLSKDENVKRCITDVSIFCEIISKDIMTLPDSCVCQAAEAIIKAMESWKWLNECDEFMKVVCNMIEVVLAKLKAVPDSIFSSMSLHRKKQTMSNILQIFMQSRSTPLTITILETLLEAWDNFCDGLRASRFHGQPLDCAGFENTYFIIRCLELIAKQWVDQAACVLDVFFLQETQDRLENSLLHLTDQFPLVSHSVWKVTALIEKALQDSNEMI